MLSTEISASVERTIISAIVLILAFGLIAYSVNTPAFTAILAVCSNAISIILVAWFAGTQRQNGNGGQK